MTKYLLAPLMVCGFLSACTRPFEPFPLHVDTPAGERIVDLRLDRRSGGRDGLLEHGDRALHLLLAEPVVVEDHNALLLAGFSRYPRNVSIALLGPDGSELLISRADEVYPGTDDREVLVPVPIPPNATVTGLSVAAGPQGSEPVRLTALWVSSGPTGVGVNGTNGRFYASPGVAVERWEDEGIGVWAVDRSAAAGWQATDPVEIRYRLERESADLEQLHSRIAVPHAAVRTAAVDFRLDLRPGRHRVVLHPAAEGTHVERLLIEANEPGLTIEWIGPTRYGELPGAVPADLGGLLRYRPEHWRQPDFELFSWTLYPEVLILDSLSYAIQSRFFKRLAFFVEKDGYRGKLLTNEQLRPYHGYNAHNYNGDGLARFFNAADRAGFELNAEEDLLRQIAVAHRIIEPTDQGYVAGAGGILGISQESSLFPTLRELLIAHEAYHGVYYMEPGFVAAIDRLWESLDEAEQHYWYLLLSGFRYDITDDYLVRNEVQAYLLQQPVAAASWYFETRSAERIARWHPAAAPWLRDYLRDYAGTHRRQAAAAQEALYRYTGLVARDVFCLTPISLR